MSLFIFYFLFLSTFNLSLILGDAFIQVEFPRYLSTTTTTLFYLISRKKYFLVVNNFCWKWKLFQFEVNNVLSQFNIYKYKIEEASSHDQIKMTKFWLDYDQKSLHQWTLTLDHDWKLTPMNINLWTWLKK